MHRRAVLASTCGFGFGVAAATRGVAAQGATAAAGDPDLVALLRATERERLRALVEADLAVAEELHADDFQLINPDGVALSKADYLGAIASGDIDYLVFEPTSEIAVLPHDGVAAVRYQSRIEIVAFGGEESVRGWHTDIYAQRDGRWRAVWSQMTRIAE